MKKWDQRSKSDPSYPDFIYEPERPIPKTETIKSLESAEEFVEKIARRIEKFSNHKKLFK